ncbi:hypothetical protein FDH96_gp010 [Mycobacterium phage Rey]|uniref:Uncharacterized protein n=1 Tax=Mycobacterium phage Rey TaxID=1034115 RepID=G1D572_9CAUD|nr:hypothetical protein FDH96_gp010 [Mycobacterium phage Rey]AEK09922.1 hypothetical protein PBI_REY_10 [Mycobacterium phage Rey]
MVMSNVKMPELPEGLKWSVQRENSWTTRDGRGIRVTLVTDGGAKAAEPVTIPEREISDPYDLGDRVKFAACRIWGRVQHDQNIAAWMEKQPWLD